ARGFLGPPLLGIVLLRAGTGDRFKTRALLSTGMGSHRLSALDAHFFRGVAALAALADVPLWPSGSRLAPAPVKPASPRPCNKHIGSHRAECSRGNKGRGAWWARRPALHVSSDSSDG